MNYDITASIFFETVNQVPIRAPETHYSKLNCVRHLKLHHEINTAFVFCRCIQLQHLRIGIKIPRKLFLFSVPIPNLAFKICNFFRF